MFPYPGVRRRIRILYPSFKFCANSYPHQYFSVRPVPVPVLAPRFFKSTRTRTKIFQIDPYPHPYPYQIFQIDLYPHPHPQSTRRFWLFFIGYQLSLRRVRNLAFVRTFYRNFLTRARKRISMFFYIIYLNFKKYVTFRVFSLLPLVFGFWK